MQVRGAVAAALLVVPTVVAPTPTHDLRCGDLVTEDSVLETSLSCDVGLELAPGVTLDLGGHTLVGPWEYVGTGLTGPRAGHATVRNGSIGNWAVGIAAGGSLTIEDVAVSGGSVGIQTGGELTLVRSSASGRYVAVECHGRCDVQDSSFDGTGLDRGLDCSNAVSCTVTRTTLASFEVAARGVRSITDSVVRDSTTGVELQGEGAVATRTEFVRNGVGLRVGHGQRVVDNVFHANETGLDALGATGSRPTDVVGNLFTANRFALTAPSSPLTLRQNVAVGSVEAGIDAPSATETGWNVGREALP